MAKAYFDAPRPIAFAHRGGAFDGIENSMEAFERCVEIGYQYLETDVHLSKDGVVVAVHDPTLDRTTDKSGSIRELTWAQISQARIGGRGTIPSLDDLLEAFPTVRFNIDAKVPEVVTPLVHTLQRHGADALARVCLASFSDTRLRKLRVLVGPQVATSMGPREMAAIKLASYRRQRRRTPRSPGDVAQIPTTIGGRPFLTKALVDLLHLMGKQVHVWTIDDADQMQALLDLGVDGIMTDEPHTLKEVLTSRGQWHDHNDSP